MKKYLHTTFIILTVTVLAAFTAAAQQKTHRSEFLDAVDAYVARNFTLAEQLLQVVVKKDPGNDAAWYYLGLCRLDQNDREGAKTYLDKAVAIDSTNYWYREAQLTTYDPSDTDLAIAKYEQLLADFPNNTDRQYVLVNWYIMDNRTDKALALLDDIEGRDGKSDASVMARSGILRSQKKIEEAYQVLKDYVAEYSSPYVLSVLGEYEMGMYNDKEALGYFNEALSLDSGYYPARLGVAETYRLTRKYREYFDVVKGIAEDREVSPKDKADYLHQVIRSTDSRFMTSFRPQMDSVINLTIQAHPTDSVILQTADAYYIYNGDMDKGAEYAKRCWDLYPESRSSAYAYIQILAMGEDWKAASEACQKAIKMYPQEDVFLELDNAARYYMKDYKGVLENSQKMLEMAAGDSAKTLSALQNIGDMYHELGDNKNAYKAYEKALKINPDCSGVLNNYAWNLALEGKQLKKAAKMSRRATELEPKNSSVLDTYGWILHLTGKDMEAKLFFKQAMLYGGKESATVLAHYIIVLEALGEKELADVYRTQLKALTKDNE